MISNIWQLMTRAVLQKESCESVQLVNAGLIMGYLLRFLPVPSLRTLMVSAVWREHAAAAELSALLMCHGAR